MLVIDGRVTNTLVLHLSYSNPNGRYSKHRRRIKPLSTGDIFLVRDSNDDNDFHQHEWPSHITCFHADIESWKACVFTCVEEIEEYEGKIKQKES